MPSSADTPRARQLGAELRHARDQIGMSGRELGKLIGRASSHIARWENGKLIPSEADTATVLGVLGVTGQERERLLDLAREAGDPNWVAPGQDRQLAALMDYEQNATRITSSAPLLIPGLLQTADYARAIMMGAGATRGEAEQRVAVRLGRRDVLTRPKAVQLVALLGRHALQSAPCPAEVMTEQLQHLLTIGARENISIQMLGLDGHYSPALEGPFVLIEADGVKPVVHLEHYRSSATITDAKDVRDFQAAAETLRREAMGPEDTSELIAKTIDGMEQPT